MMLRSISRNQTAVSYTNVAFAKPSVLCWIYHLWWFVAFHIVCGLRCIFVNCATKEEHSCFSWGETTGIQKVAPCSAQPVPERDKPLCFDLQTFHKNAAALTNSDHAAYQHWTGPTLSIGKFRKVSLLTTAVLSYCIYTYLIPVCFNDSSHSPLMSLIKPNDFAHRTADWIFFKL